MARHDGVVHRIEAADAGNAQIAGLAAAGREILRAFSNGRSLDPALNLRPAFERRTRREILER